MAQELIATQQELQSFFVLYWSVDSLGYYAAVAAASCRFGGLEHLTSNTAQPRGMQSHVKKNNKPDSDLI